MARFPMRIPIGLLVVTAALPFSLALGTAAAHAAAPVSLGQGALRAAPPPASDVPDTSDPGPSTHRDHQGEEPGLLDLTELLGAIGADGMPSAAAAPPGKGTPSDGRLPPRRPADDTAGPPRPHVPPHAPPAAPHRPSAPAPPTPAPRPPAPHVTRPAPHRSPDGDRTTEAASPSPRATPSHHRTAHRHPAVPPHRPARVPAAVPHAVRAEESSASAPAVREADDRQTPDTQAEPPATDDSYPFAGTGTHAERVLPMGAGMALTGLGLAFLALRLRRG
ncbi:hypothetical protein ACGH2B_13870 [Streptomyces sp. BBFR2]|uniref:hypothetical protein n=1 Tax=Streptomyces sp. BBFR2 TaxID=3372854 RepID=UPI0037DA30B3